jgi:general nucleoside transport system permease protein
MFENVIEGIFSAAFLASILRVTTPILLPSLGALLSDRAGVINIGLEGIMLGAAFTGVWVSAQTQNPWLGFIAGLMVAVLLALMLGFFHLNLGGDLILSGIALNILGSAGTVAIMFELTGDRGNTSTLASLQMPFVQLPEFINDIPLVGGFIFDALDNQNIMTWIAFISVFFVWYFLYRTPIGMHLRAVGENPEAAASVGINVRRVRYLALFLSGIFAGMGGIHLSMGYLALFQRDMTTNRGFIALATPSLGGGHPVGTMIASVIFGFFDAIGIRIGSLDIPSQLPQMIPFVATVMGLVIYALQAKLTVRIRALRAAEGEGFDAAFWRVVQRLSVLHIVMAMFAVFGIIVSISLFAAPDGFQGEETAYPAGLATAVVSLILIAINLPFITHVERIGHNGMASAAVCTLSLGVYLALFLTLFIRTPSAAILLGLVLALAFWLLLGGWRLTQRSRPTAVAAT